MLESTTMRKGNKLVRQQSPYSINMTNGEQLPDIPTYDHNVWYLPTLDDEGHSLMFKILPFCVKLCTCLRTDVKKRKTVWHDLVLDLLHRVINNINKHLLTCVNTQI